MKESEDRFQVFISHASSDVWVARQLQSLAHSCGADTFLDCEHIEHGEDFEERIVAAAEQSTELLVLYTPAARERKYVWMEIGMFLGSRKRIVTVLYGVKKEDIAADQFTPLVLKRIKMVDLNDVDSYFTELKGRVDGRKKHHG